VGKPLGTRLVGRGTQIVVKGNISCPVGIHVTYNNSVP